MAKKKSDVESSFNKNVLKKKGYPDGYHLVLSREKKEVALTIRPYSKKNYNYLKGDLQKNMEMTLKKKHASDYHAKVLAYWKPSNLTEEQNKAELILDQVSKEMEGLYSVGVSTGYSVSATVDGSLITDYPFLIETMKKSQIQSKLINIKKSLFN
ncbi:hypothetical protein RAH41_02230 [Gottfriedia acidiceleris]|uniref:hypothetical protein n=1 Tax=Gottfriedia acidiceleris TaxID=371036 RepID=UPI002F26AA2D